MGVGAKKIQIPRTVFLQILRRQLLPAAFIEDGGRNRTPNQLRASERKPLLAICDQALRLSIKWLKPRYVIGVGKFATERARTALIDQQVIIGVITHPSPANPKANRGWEQVISREFTEMGIQV